MLDRLKTMTKGITRRWLITTFGVILPIVLLLIICLSVSVSSLCNSTIEQSLSYRINELATTFPKYSCANTQDFATLSTQYLNDFPYKDNIELEIINAGGRVTVTSTGFEHDTNIEMEDYNLALQSKDNFGKWMGKLPSGENVIAVTKTISNPQGSNIGAVRYVVSLRKVSFTVFMVALISSLIGLIVIFLVALAGGYFIKSILNPVTELRDTAKKIAGGNFSIKVEKKTNDEIGDLCDSINDMASELDASERMKNDFISRVSHELRTPLTAINGWADTMRSGPLDKITFEKGINTIAHESLRLEKLVVELLDFSKLQSGRLQLKMARIDLLAEVEEAILMFKEQARKENKELLYDEPEENLPAVYGDSDRLKQVIINIIDNAFKYTPYGGMIGVEVFRDFKDDMIKITVADNGCGIDSDDLPKIKNKFYKANQKVDGSGIGLAVADEIIALHKGTLNIESSPDIGTTVTIGVPIYNKAVLSLDNNY